MRNTHDYYELLGVPPNASRSRIKKAYRRAAVRWHPDINSSPHAGEMMKRVNAARDVLLDPEKRRAYDLTSRAYFIWQQRQKQGYAGTRGRYTGHWQPEAASQSRVQPEPARDGDGVRPFVFAVALIILVIAVFAVTANGADQSNQRFEPSAQRFQGFVSPQRAPTNPIGGVRQTQPFAPFGNGSSFGANDPFGVPGSTQAFGQFGRPRSNQRISQFGIPGSNRSSDPFGGNHGARPNSQGGFGGRGQPAGPRGFGGVGQSTSPGGFGGGGSFGSGAFGGSFR